MTAPAAISSLTGGSLPIDSAVPGARVATTPARATRARKLVGMNARDELGFERRLEDPARLRDREVAAVAEHVAEPCSCNMRVGAPARHLLGVGPEPGASVGGLGVGGQEGDLDPRQVFAIAEALEDARSLELALALEVIARLRLDGGGAALEPATQPVRGRLLERCRSRGPRGVDGGHDASARLRHLFV